MMCTSKTIYMTIIVIFNRIVKTPAQPTSMAVCPEVTVYENSRRFEF